MGAKMAGIVDVWRFGVGDAVDWDKYIMLDYGGENIGCIRKPDRENNEKDWIRNRSRILYKRRGVIEFYEAAYLASAFAKNKKMEEFINKFYDDYEEYFEIYLEGTPYKQHRIFISMDAATRMRALKALAIINVAGDYICLNEFMLRQMKRFYRRIYERYYKRSLSGKAISIYKDLVSEYDLASLSVQELGELYATRLYVIRCSMWSRTISGMHKVFDDADLIINLYLAAEDMAMLKPYGVLYPYKEPYMAKAGYLNKWIWPKWDDISIPAWEEAWTIDEYKLLVKTTVGNRKRLIEYVTRSKNKKAQS